MYHLYDVGERWEMAWDVPQHTWMKISYKLEREK